jgi:hypothetical protein
VKLDVISPQEYESVESSFVVWALLYSLQLLCASLWLEETDTCLLVWNLFMGEFMMLETYTAHFVISMPI